MSTVTIHKAKTELSKLLKRVESGEEVVIARGNKPIARLLAVETPPKKRLGYGSMKHLLGKIPDSFYFDPLPEEELKLWEGGDCDCESCSTRTP